MKTSVTAVFTTTALALAMAAPTLANAADRSPSSPRCSAVAVEHHGCPGARKLRRGVKRFPGRHSSRRTVDHRRRRRLTKQNTSPARSASVTDTSSAPAAVSCSFYASPSGSDSAAGSLQAPFQTAQQLVNSLQPGQTGCLESGTYNEDVTVSQGGSATAPVILASAPGETATIVGRFWVAQGANYVTVTGLDLDGTNAGALPSPTVNAANTTFSYDNVTNDHTAVCFDLGSSYGVAANTLIEYDRIHDCGILPANNHEHGIYVQDSTNATIAWNEIYDNADRGIQLYPDAQGTTVDHNVIADNGENFDFSGDNGTAADNSDVYDNIIANPVDPSYNVYSWYPTGNPIGTGNTLQNNCITGGAPNTSDGGFAATGNTTATDPEFINATAGDFQLAATSPCQTVTGDIAAAIDAS
jgi:parallel beta-helix repeat protein